MKAISRWMICSLVPVNIIACSVEEDPSKFGELEEAFGFDDSEAKCNADPRVLTGVVSLDVCIGADLFFREPFGGNGRSCASCHPVANNFTIDKAFIDTLPADDPLFVAEFDPDLAGLEVPEQMRARGLILENVDGFEPDPTVRFVLRTVPHNLSMGVSVTRPPDAPAVPPLDRTGWGGDGAPGQGELRDFQNGAITQHYTQSLKREVGTDFRLAEDRELDAIDLFMRTLGRTNELDLATVVMTDADAEAGRARFLNVGCNACHQNAGANAAIAAGGNRNFNTGVEAARHADLAGFPLDGGFGATPENPDGSFGNGTFNTPPLVESADTGPFFHSATTVSGSSERDADTATTIEDAVAFYDTPAFNNSPSGQVAPIDLTADEIDQIGRFLRGINAVFNAQMAIKRLDAVLAIIAGFGNQHLNIQRQLLTLARVEVDDALAVLREAAGGPMNQNAIDSLTAARGPIGRAISASGADRRRTFTQRARDHASKVADGVGTNLSFAIGEGTNMF